MIIGSVAVRVAFLAADRLLSSHSSDLHLCINGSEVTATVNIATGLDPPGADCCSGGKLQYLSLWNEQGEHLGTAGGYGCDGLSDNRKLKIQAGRTNKYYIEQHSSQQAAYVELSREKDDLCISVIDVAWAGNTGDYGWVGDWGAHCGLEWSYTSYIVSLVSLVKGLCTDILFIG